VPREFWEKGVQKDVSLENALNTEIFMENVAA
jgi:hypothetical protein